LKYFQEWKNMQSTSKQEVLFVLFSEKLKSTQGYMHNAGLSYMRGSTVWMSHAFFNKLLEVKQLLVIHGGPLS
jgi:hypothetical protein